MKIITVAFGKGGTGKTTTANSLINAARLAGLRTLGVDLDAQANLTVSMGGNPAETGLYSVLTEQTTAQQAIQHTPQGDLIAAGLNLAAAEQTIQGRPGRDFILKTALQPILKDYDLIVCDTPPALNSLLVNALAASDGVILTMQARTFAIMGLYQIGETISQVKRYCNPALSVLGILYTQHTPNRALSRDLVEDIEQQAQAMGTRVFDAYIRPAEALPQAQAMQQSIFDYAPKSRAAADYKALFDELGITERKD
jgi:chromosome partitioning protein